VGTELEVLKIAQGVKANAMIMITLSESAMDRWLFNDLVKLTRKDVACTTTEEVKEIWNLLRAEGDKLRAEGDKLWAEGDKLWAEAILEVHGNIKLEWKNYDSKKDDFERHLETGEVFKP
jgi:hypothetical protein